MSMPRWFISSSYLMLAIASAVGCAGGPTNAPYGDSLPVDMAVPPRSTPIQPTSNRTVVRQQSPGGEVAPAVAEFDNAAPGSNGLSRTPMRPSGEVRQVQFEQGPPIAPPPNNFNAPGNNIPANNGNVVNNQPVFVPPGGGQPLPAPPETPIFDPAWPGVTGQGSVVPPTRDIDVYVEETQTGRFMFGVGVNSDAGVSGNIVIDERNFDAFRVPTSWSDFTNGSAFRGAGQGFRLEAAPGTQVQRYLFTFTEPYLFDTDVSASISGFYFNRIYQNWTEERLGGRLGLGYRLAPDLSVGGTLRAENVNISNPSTLGVAALDNVLGNNDIYSGRVNITHDTRDLPFAPTQGHYLDFSFEQAFGEFSFPRAEVDARKYYLIRERPDGSGRHTVGLTLRVGASGSDTPIFENYFAGGYSSMRGFNFRGASPTEMGVQVGGQFKFLGSVEYMFPLTADDMIKGVAFCDYGTVESGIEFNSENFRVAPGLGLRINIPALGPAPLAFDFAVPVAHADGDNIQNFSFFFGFGR